MDHSRYLAQIVKVLGPSSFDFWSCKLPFWYEYIEFSIKTNIKTPILHHTLHFFDLSLVTLSLLREVVLQSLVLCRILVGLTLEFYLFLLGLGHHILQVLHF